MTDLFENIETLPATIQEIINRYNIEDLEYSECENFKNELELSGYTCEYDLSATVFNLQTV